MAFYAEAWGKALSTFSSLASMEAYLAEFKTISDDSPKFKMLSNSSRYATARRELLFKKDMCHFL